MQIGKETIKRDQVNIVRSDFFIFCYISVYMCIFEVYHTVIGDYCS